MLLLLTFLALDSISTLIIIIFYIAEEILFSIFNLSLTDWIITKPPVFCGYLHYFFGMVGGYRRYVLLFRYKFSIQRLICVIMLCTKTWTLEQNISSIFFVSWTSYRKWYWFARNYMHTLLIIICRYLYIRIFLITSLLVTEETSQILTTFYYILYYDDIFLYKSIIQFS